jgi:diaminopimelate decarboxylase
VVTAVETLYPEHSEVREGRLSVGGCDAGELARRFGTPLYVVAEDDLRARAREFTAAMPGEVVFASKAFPCTAVLKVFHEEGLSVDVASGGELALAQRAGFEGPRMILHGNAKSEAELRAATSAGARIVIDNFDELERLERIEAPCDALIRVTPGVVADTHAKILTGHAGSKFGFSLADAPQAIQRLQDAPWAALRGLHMHIGSQLFDLEPFRAGVAALAALGDFGTYDLGGGVAATYLEDEPAPEADAWVEACVGAVHDFMGPGKRILLEPGRALVANACVTVYTVQTVKRNASTWVAVDGGMSDNLRPMLYGARYETMLANRADATGGERCAVAGKHCESGDVLVRDAHLDDPRPGDLLVTPATGAYGHALANNYNGVPRPPVVFCRDGDARLVVRRETYEDLTRRDVV